MQLGTAKVLNDLVTIEMRRTYAKVFGLLKVFDYQGRIGAQTLKHFLLTLNLAKNRLILRPKGSPHPLGIPVPFTSVRDLIMLSGFVGGRGPFNLLLDPGAPTLVLAPGVVDQVGLSQGKGQASAEVQIEGLPTQRYLISPDKSLEDARTDGVALDGLLGRNFLEDWQVTIDFERHMLYFEKP
jgi:hypothetical protein